MMKKYSFHLRILALGTIFLSSCYYDVESELYPLSACISVNMTYIQDVLPIMQRSCYSCHNHDNAQQNGNIVLESYDAVLQYVQNGTLIGSIRRENGFESMPRNASKLNDCEIIKIESWVNNGAPYN